MVSRLKEKEYKLRSLNLIDVVYSKVWVPFLRK